MSGGRRLKRSVRPGLRLDAHRANGATLWWRAVQAASETMRVLQSLGTADAKAAFEAGGGGKKSEAERLLAAAKSAERAAKQAAKEAASKPGERQALTPSGSLGSVRTYSQHRCCRFAMVASAWNSVTTLSKADEASWGQERLVSSVSKRAPSSAPVLSDLERTAIVAG